MIIYFATTARLVWNAPLYSLIPEHVWKLRGGFTNYGAPLKLAFEHMCNKNNKDMHIKEFDYALMYFYTDGNAHYPNYEMDQIESLVAKNREDWFVKGNSNRSKLRTIMMNEMENNDVIDLIK
jgi:hypothetical protein